MRPFPAALRGVTLPLGWAEQSPHLHEGAGAVRGTASGFASANGEKEISPDIVNHTTRSGG
jgi:hypothetical protein